MAQEKIEIKFIATGNVALVKAIKELDKATKRLNKEFKTLNTTQEKVSDSTEKLGHRVGRNTKKVNANSTAFTRLQSIISVYRNKMLLASFATGLIIKPLTDLVKLSADFEDLERGFNKLGRSIDLSSEGLNKLRAATNGTVNDMELMKQANNAMMLGVVQSEDEMAQLFDTAQRLGQALGKDAVHSIESMVTGMGRQSRLMLDNIGIMVKAEVAYKNFAKEQGIQVKNLDDAQKKTAFNNEVLRQSEAIMHLVGEEVLSTNANIARMQVSTVNLGKNVGEALTPALVAASDAFVALADSINVEVIQQLISMLLAAGSIFVGVKIAVATLGTAMVQLTIAAKAAFGAKVALTMALGTIAKTLAVVFAKVTLVVGGIFLLGKAIKSLIFDVEEQDKHFGQLVTTLETVKSATADFSDGIAKLNKLYQNSTEGQLERKENHLDEIRALRMFGLLTEEILIVERDLLKQKEEIIKKQHESTEAGKAEIEADKEKKKLLKELEGAYKSTEKGQIAFIKSQIEAAENLPKLTEEQIAGLEALKQKLIELEAEAGAFNMLGENLTMALETLSGFLEEQVALTQASAEAKMAIYDQEANAEIDALKKSRKFKKKSDRKQQEEIDKLRAKAEDKKQKERDKANKQMALQFRLNQLLAVSDAVMNISIGYSKALAQGGFVLGIPMATAVAALGAVQVATILAQKPPKMAQGGLVGGRRHSQGGTMIEAEQGEFVMNRNAVDAIGVENLNRMNTGGGGGANITFSGNVMSDDFIETEAIPKIREAIRRGSDIGVS